MIKKVFLAALTCGVIASAFVFGRAEIALSGSAQIAELQNLGMSTELAAKVDQLYSSSVPVAPVYRVGVNAQLGAHVPTPAATPVANVNRVLPGLNIVPTAAANTAMFIGAATPVPGQQFVVTNSGPNAVRLKAAGGATLNGATAGGFISLAANATVQCYTASPSNQTCLQPVIPTPAGP